MGCTVRTRPPLGVVTVGTPRDPSQLHRDAVAIWRLLVELDEDDHRLRSQLLAARQQLRAEAATQWRAAGWRSITDDRASA